MDLATCKRKVTEINKMKGSRRKVWETSKKFAAECDVDTKVFNKGLGPTLDKIASLARGAAETGQFVPLDERSFTALRKEKAKLDTIIKAYLALATKNKPKDATNLAHWGWVSMETLLGDMQRNADKMIAVIDKQVKQTAHR